MQMRFSLMNFHFPTRHDHSGPFPLPTAVKSCAVLPGGCGLMAFRRRFLRVIVQKECIVPAYRCAVLRVLLVLILQNRLLIVEARRTVPQCHIDG